MWSSDKVPATKVEGIQIRTAFQPLRPLVSIQLFLSHLFGSSLWRCIWFCHWSLLCLCWTDVWQCHFKWGFEVDQKKMRLWRMSQIPFNFVRKLFYVKITQPRKFSQNCCLMPLIALNFSIQILLLFNFHNTDKIFFK